MRNMQQNKSKLLQDALVKVREKMESADYAQLCKEWKSKDKALETKDMRNFNGEMRAEGLYPTS